MFEKKNGQKNCARYFQIHKCAFLILEKGDEQKNCQVFSDCKYAFLIFGKGDEQKKLPGIFGFVSMLF